jgi:hypothetical protein
MPDLSYICYCCYFLGDDVNACQLGNDAANLDVVNSCLDEVNDGGKFLLLLFRNYARFILYLLLLLFLRR